MSNNQFTGVNVLSLFDGMSCGQIALERSGIKVNKYYASEIDKHAVKVSSIKYPNTIHLGDVTKVDASKLDRIDILIGGSPCQGFSFAGKGLNFDDPRSALFFEYVRILNDIMAINPNVIFFLENVRMKKEHEDVISRILDIQPVNFNSNLVSAQNRERLYWTNIGIAKRGLFGDNYCTIEPPKDRGLYLRDVLQSDVAEKYYISKSQTERLNLGDLKTAGQISFNSPGKENNKATAILARDYKGISGKQGYNVVCVAMRGRESSVLVQKRTDFGKVVRKEYEAGRISVKRSNIQQLEPRTDGKTNTLTSVAKDNLVFENKRVKGVDITERGIRPHRGDVKKSGISEFGTILFSDVKCDTLTTNHPPLMIDVNKQVIQLNPATESGGKQPYQQNRVYSVDGLAHALCAQLTTGSVAIAENYRIRRLTPIECCRLQTVADDYFYDENGQPIVSETQMYKMLGNGWTVEMIVHFFKHIYHGN